MYIRMISQVEFKYDTATMAMDHVILVGALPVTGILPHLGSPYPNVWICMVVITKFLQYFSPQLLW